MYEDTTVHLPATIGNAKVAKAAEEYGRLRPELDVEQLRRMNLDQTRAQAEQMTVRPSPLSGLARVTPVPAPSRRLTGHHHQQAQGGSARARRRRE